MKKIELQTLLMIVLFGSSGFSAVNFWKEIEIQTNAGLPENAMFCAALAAVFALIAVGSGIAASFAVSFFKK